MVDESVVLTYEAQLDRIVTGNRRTTPDWDDLFEETPKNANLDTRIRQVFEDTGFVPARIQYERVQKNLLEGKHLLEAEEALQAGEEPDLEDAKPKKTRAK